MLEVSLALIATILTPQEKEDAQRLFETDPEALAADRTFEPGEGLVEAEGPAEDEEMVAAPEPTLRKGPTPEQITAIKVCTPPPQEAASHAWSRKHAADHPHLPPFRVHPAKYGTGVTQAHSQELLHSTSWERSAGARRADLALAALIICPIMPHMVLYSPHRAAVQTVPRCL